jgi:hypothetical protein
VKDTKSIQTVNGLGDNKWSDGIFGHTTMVSHSTPMGVDFKPLFVDALEHARQIVDSTAPGTPTYSAQSMEI